jgi:hypothetical protein
MFVGCVEEPDAFVLWQVDEDVLIGMFVGCVEESDAFVLWQVDEEGLCGE